MLAEYISDPILANNPGCSQNARLSMRHRDEAQTLSEAPPETAGTGTSLTTFESWFLMIQPVFHRADYLVRH